MSDVPRFPLFVSLSGKNALIVGGGTIAARRANTLLAFGAIVTVVAPELSPEMEALLERIIWRRERYAGLDKDYLLAVAATDDREVNRQAGEDAKAAGIFVSVADKKEESSFWFPGVALGGGLVAGVVSEAGNHGAVKKAAEKIRTIIESFSKIS